jgi:carboxypeptidase C (cathepsin A)
MIARRLLVGLLASVLAIESLPGAATAQAPQTAAQSGGGKAGPEAKLLPDSAVVTQHSVRIGNQPVAYTAEAGWMPIRENGKQVARMFYIAYTRNGVGNTRERPLVFSFNGGPGTASVWMHMGYTGPRRVVYDDEGFALRPPGTIADNDASVLDIADIVYIDPIATGFSRMEEGEELHKFHGKLSDIRSVGEFIRMYLVRKDRWNSPKFLIGESYGTTRASGLAGHLLSEHQIYINGVILVSMTGLDIERGQDVSYATALPAKTATAWYHKQLPPDLQSKPLRTVLNESETFAMGPYLAALVKGDRISDAERDAIAQRVAQLTGLTSDYVKSSNLRVDVGRLDSRYKGIDRDAAGENPEFDPALADWNGPFANVVNRYLREELKYNPDLRYNVWGDVRPWAQDEGTNVADMLRSAMRNNPYLKVMIQSGYYDAATDYFSADYTISHIQHGGEFKNRFRTTYYESGHMMYLRNADRVRANEDLRAFIRWCLEDRGRVTDDR